MNIRIIVKFNLVVVLCVFFTVFAIANDYPTSLEKLEAYEAKLLVDENASSDQVTTGTMLKQFNLHVLHTKLACIKAIGHEGFCHCISENMPADQEFANYVVAVS